MSKAFDTISTALGTTFIKQDEEIIEDVPAKKSRVSDVVNVASEYKLVVKHTKDDISQNFAEDYEFIRETLKDLMSDGKDALETAKNLAEETESPRAYEVCTSIINTIAGLGSELVKLHKEAVKMNSDSSPVGTNITAENVTNVQNNYYPTTPKELQKILDTVEEVQYDDSDLE